MTYEELQKFKEWCRETGKPFDFKSLPEWPEWDTEKNKPRR
jgi:hypothetical protein